MFGFNKNTSKSKDIYQVVKISVDTQGKAEEVKVPEGLVFIEAVSVVREPLQGKGGRIILTLKPEETLLCVSSVGDRECQVSRPHAFRYVTSAEASLKPVVEGVFTKGKVDFYCVFMKVD